MFFCFCLSPCEFDLHVWAIPILYFIYWNHGLLHRFFGHTQRSLDEADVHCGNWKLLDQIAARLFDYHRCDGPCDRACKMWRSVPNHWPCRESENHVIIISNPHFETLHFWLLELDLAGQCNIFARCFRMQNCSFSSLPLGTQIAVKDLMFYVLCFHVFSLRFIKMRCSIMLFIHFLAVLYQWFCNTDAGGAKDPFSMGSMSELRNHQPKEIEVGFSSKKNVGDFVQNWGTPDIQLSMVSCSFPPQRSKKVEAHHVLFGPWQSKSQNCLISKPKSQFSLHQNISKAMSCSPFPFIKNQFLSSLWHTFTIAVAVAQARSPRGRTGRTDAVENHGEDAAGGGRWESLGLGGAHLGASMGLWLDCNGIYPLVNIQKPMENHHFLWGNQLWMG